MIKNQVNWTSVVGYMIEKLKHMQTETISRCSKKLAAMLATLLDFDLFFTHLTSWIDHGFLQHYEVIDQSLK